MSQNNNANKRSSSVSNQKRDLVSKAYNNQIIAKNQNGEYAPIGTDLIFKKIL